MIKGKYIEYSISEYSISAVSIVAMKQRLMDQVRRVLVMNLLGMS